MIKTHPIFFNGDMVRAILEGRKSQTRRIIKPQPDCAAFGGKPYWNIGGLRLDEDSRKPLKCPYGQPDDLLWVRENWGYHGMGKSSTDRWKTKNMGVSYHADGRRTSGLDYKGADVLKLPADYPVGKVVTMPDDLTDEECHAWRHRKKSIPSIHMPRWASRITLEIKDIRVERLQDISEGDAECEGISCALKVDLIPRFQNLWKHINGPDSWQENLWVWVPEFETHLCNVDEYLKRAG